MMYYDDLALSAGPEEGLKIRGARNILCRSWFEAALVYKRRIFSFKKLSARLLLMNQNSSDDGLSGCNMMILLSLSAGPEEGLKIRGHVKSDNLQYNMLVCWFTGTNDSSTKCLMFQVLFCSFIISCKIICNIVSIYLIFKLIKDSKHPAYNGTQDQTLFLLLHEALQAFHYYSHCKLTVIIACICLQLASCFFTKYFVWSERLSAIIH